MVFQKIEDWIKNNSFKYLNYIYLIKNFTCNGFYIYLRIYNAKYLLLTIKKSVERYAYVFIIQNYYKNNI